MDDPTAPRPGARGRWTIKAAGLDHAFQNLVRMAAAKQGQSVGVFVLTTLRDRAQAILKREADPSSTPASTWPMRPEDLAAAIATQLAVVIERTGEEQAARLAAELERQGQTTEARLAEITRAMRRGRWRR